MWHTICECEYCMSSHPKYVKESQSSCLLYWISVRIHTDCCIEQSTCCIRIHIRIRIRIRIRIQTFGSTTLWFCVAFEYYWNLSFRT